jgi:DUF2075 family protein/predicted GIY-YIG superfamily endonuclease
MTDFDIVDLPFDQDSVVNWSLANEIARDWPVVYILNSDKEVYVGETINAQSRLQQHLSTESKKNLKRVQIVLSSKFNKSACLDLESQLIQYLAADGAHRVLNANAGIVNGNYFDRQEYRATFQELFDRLVDKGLLTRPIPEIINSNLFKYSPFKSLTSDQAIAVKGILDEILKGRRKGKSAKIVVEGDPGTGKTIIAIYLMKLLQDIANISDELLVDEDSIFAEYMTHENSELLSDYKVGLVIPQQALRTTLANVFSKTPGLNKKMILKPFSVGGSDEKWDLLIIDEAHRLSMRANQAFPTLNTLYVDINKKLFGKDDFKYTQLDWMVAQSDAQVLLLDPDQTIKPLDLPRSVIDDAIEDARSTQTYFKLHSQLRVSAGQDYVEFVQRLLTDNPMPNPGFGEYDLKFFDLFTDMREAILHKNEEFGLSRILAGYAWKWISKKDPTKPDIEIEGLKLFWNQTDKDWINSKNSELEVGSIHTIQGYDLNYAGVVIGNDIGFDPASSRIVFRRDNYFDSKGTLNNLVQGIVYSDDDILQYIVNIYRVLLTRGIKGTYIYVHDPELRKILEKRLEVMGS